MDEMAQQILAAQSERMKSAAIEDKNLPLVAVVDTKKFSSFRAESGVGAKVDKAVSSLFDGKFMGGFKSAVSTALDTFLGNATAGKQENTEFHVVFDRNALIRIDLYYYKYEFSSRKLKDHAKNMFCYVAQVAVLDILEINPMVTLYELSKSVGGSVSEFKEDLIQESGACETFIKQLRKLEIEQGEDDDD